MHGIMVKLQMPMHVDVNLGAAATKRSMPSADIIASFSSTSLCLFVRIRHTFSPPGLLSTTRDGHGAPLRVSARGAAKRWTHWHQ